MKEQKNDTHTVKADGTCTSSAKCRTNASVLLTAVILTGILMAAAIARSTPEPEATNRPADAGSVPKSSPAAAETKSIAWRANYDAALEEAAAKEMPVLLRFTANWCPPCKVMDATVWPNEKVASTVAARVIPVKIDIDDPAAQAVAEKYGVRTIPTLIMVDAAGKESARGAFMSSGGVIEFLDRGFSKKTASVAAEKADTGGTYHADSRIIPSDDSRS
jgi:thiol:disulfide interchange protein